MQFDGSLRDPRMIGGGFFGGVAAHLVNHEFNSIWLSWGFVVAWSVGLGLIVSLKDARRSRSHMDKE